MLIFLFTVVKKTPAESVRLAECIGEVRALLRQILSDSLPVTTKSKGKTRSNKSKYQVLLTYLQKVSTIV